MMKKFNMEEWIKNKSKKVVTKNGKNAKIICINADKEYPVGAIIEVENSRTLGLFKSNGVYSNGDHNYDLFFIEEPKFKVGDRISYKDHLYRITNIGKNWYNVVSFPPYDKYGIKCAISFTVEDDIVLKPEPELTELQKYLKLVVNSFHQRTGEPAEVEAMTNEGAIRFSEEVIALVKKQLEKESENEN